MLTQAARTLLAVTLATGVTVIGMSASDEPSLAVPRSPVVTGLTQDLIGRLPGTGLAVTSSLGG